MKRIYAYTDIFIMISYVLGRLLAGYIIKTRDFREYICLIIQIIEYR